jgi:hypothetical protein
LGGSCRRAIHTEQRKTLIHRSWGEYYTMTWAFFEKFVDEAYAIADPDWISAKKTTPAGLTIRQLQQAMQALKGN